MGIKKNLILLFGLVALLVSGSAAAQVYPELTKNGTDYYVYTVEPGNTLYAISKLFSIRVQDLSEANPNAKDGLSIGQEILIPKKKIDKRTARKSELAVDGKYILHTVQKKETLFSISGKYGVNVNEVMELNPEAAQSLGIGDVIKIPAISSNQVKSIFLDPARNDTFMVHQVKKGETLYALSKQYGITVDSLKSIKSDPDIGVKEGEWLTIPKYKESYLEKIDTIQLVETPKTLYPNSEKATYKIGLMLPFELSYNDSIGRALADRQDLYILTEIALDYYRGTLIALDSLKKMGLNAEVYVYDVGEDLVRVKEILKKPEIKDIDIVFGPMHKASIALVSDATKKNQNYLVSPNSFANEVFEDNPYLMRAMASRETVMRYLANFVAINHQKDNVLMLNSKSAKDWPYRKLFKENYNKAVGSFPNDVSDSIRSVGISLTQPGNIGIWLKKDRLNVIVVPSNELAFVSDFMTKLSRIDSEYDIQVYGLDNWIRYDNIDAQYKNQFRLRLVMPNFVDYENKATIDFLKKYRAQYQMEPTQYGYGFLGFDLTMYFGECLLRYGLGFPTAFSEFEMKGVNANYHYGKSTTGKEFENKSVYIVEYNDFQIKQVN